ncbi:MAG: lysylphosphatidylglycerol synthase transmembrane domain-containing protein [Acidobacteriota bacterium]
MTDADDDPAGGVNPVRPDPTRKDRVGTEVPDGEIPQVPRPSVRKILFRIVFIVVALGISGWILVRTFEDLDGEEILEAARSLNDAEIISLLSLWVLWIAAQGLLTASLVPGLAVRHGIVAFLGPASITSVVPGPSDLPIRYRMLTSWGHTTADATLAVAAGGIFSIGIKLVLPVIAALGLVVSDAPLSDTLQTVVTICIIVGLGVVVLSFVLGSEKRTEQAGKLIEPVWSRVLRLLRKPTPEDLPTQMVAARSKAVQTLRDRWLVATWATVLTSATKFGLLLMCLRFTGVSETELPWTQVFVVFALVQGLTVFPITAGDAGVSEIAYIGMLTAAAGEEYVNQITAAILIFRILTWLSIIPVGLGALGLWKLQLRRHPPAVTPGLGPPA